MMAEVKTKQVQWNVPVRWLMIAALMISWLLSGFAAAAADETLKTTELERRLHKLTAELESEQDRLTSLNTTLQAQLENARKERRQLADELLMSQVEARQRTAVEPYLRKTVSLAERLMIYLDKIPGSASLAGKLDTSLKGLKSGKSTSERLKEVAETFAVFAGVIDQAGRVSLTATELHTAKGRLEPVALLRLGHIAFAYRTEDGRIGMAVESPQDAEGFRWHEGLTRKHKAQLQVLFDQASSGASGLVDVPVDVTGRLRAEALIDTTTFRDRLRSGGLVMFPLAGIALLAIVFICERLIVLGRERSVPLMIERIMSAVDRGELEKAEQLCVKSSNTVTRVLAACLKRRQQGQHAMEDTIQEQLLHETPRLNRFLAGIAVLGAVAPLLGLLGTVTGIIQTFDVITALGEASPNQMAGGVSEALVTTATGLAMAIPIVLMYSVLSSRVGSILADAEKHAATLLNRIVAYESSALHGNAENAKRIS
jgi:biopolymer transport protein ExbB